MPAPPAASLTDPPLKLAYRTGRDDLALPRGLWVVRVVGNLRIRSVWFITNGQVTPRLVTAYPAGARP
jgi:hypothetical protein